jgi:hypothetical protein
MGLIAKGHARVQTVFIRFSLVLQEVVEEIVAISTCIAYKSFSYGISKYI